MTKNTTRKAPAKKAAASKTKAAPEPMDAAIREEPVGVMASNRKRNCYALSTLVTEFRDLFPETPIETSNYTGLNVALDVTFDLTVLDNDDAILATQLLGLVENDSRVERVVSEDTQTLVSFFASFRTQDSREPFNLGDAYMVLVEEAGL